MTGLGWNLVGVLLMVAMIVYAVIVIIDAEDGGW